MKLGFIKNSSSNRVFCDYVMRLFAVEIVLGSFITGHEQCPSYSKYKAEIKTGIHGGFNMIFLHEKVSPKELHEMNRLIFIARQETFKTSNCVANFLQKHLGVTDDYTFVIGDLEHSLKIRNQK